MQTNQNNTPLYRRAWAALRAPKLRAGIIAVAAVSALLPFGAYGGTNLRLRGTSSVYIDAYVNFVAATTFELFQMMFALVNLPAGDIGIGTNSIVKDLSNRKSIGMANGVSVAIKGLKGEMIQVSCAQGAALSNGYQQMPISNVEIAAGKRNTGDFGEATACDGAETPILSHVLQDDKDENTLFIGARVQVSANLNAARYSTTMPNGAPITIEIGYI